MDIKNNSRLLISVVVIVFLIVVFINEIKRNRNKVQLGQNRQSVMGTTVGCDKNIRSSMHLLHYQFSYKNTIYFGSQDFDIHKRGNICKGVNFLVVFDSLNPNNNQILLDSAIVNR